MSPGLAWHSPAPCTPAFQRTRSRGLKPLDVARAKGRRSPVWEIGLVRKLTTPLVAAQVPVPTRPDSQGLTHLLLQLLSFVLLPRKSCKSYGIREVSRPAQPASPAQLREWLIHVPWLTQQIRERLGDCSMREYYQRPAPKASSFPPAPREEECMTLTWKSGCSPQPRHSTPFAFILRFFRTLTIFWPTSQTLYRDLHLSPQVISHNFSHFPWRYSWDSTFFFNYFVQDTNTVLTSTQMNFIFFSLNILLSNVYGVMYYSLTGLGLCYWLYITFSMYHKWSFK